MSMQTYIEQTLQDGLKPDWLSVINESYLHRSSGPDAESHFKVVVVSSIFEGERLVARHCIPTLRQNGWRGESNCLIQQNVPDTKLR